jgi:two-component system, cell cycle sensor histidine kinase and response regulator CckA
MDDPVRLTARILVMDDEESILDVTSEILRVFGYEVGVATSGEMALEKYQAAMDEGDRYDLVIMDLTVPMGMGGGEAIKELLKIDPQAKAIVSTGLVDEPLVKSYRSHGFKGILPKPYRMQDLERVVRTALNEPVEGRDKVVPRTE